MPSGPSPIAPTSLADPASALPGRAAGPDAASAGRAIGAMVMTGFGAAWLALWAVASFEPPWFALGAIAVPALAPLVAARRRYRRHRPALVGREESPDERRRGRQFHLVNAGQWVVVFVVATVLTHTGHGRWVLPAIIAIVGLHFLPLARLFRSPPHAVTGVVLTAWAIVYSLLPGVGPESSLGALGAGLVLWSSAAWALRPDAHKGAVGRAP